MYNGHYRILKFWVAKYTKRIGEIPGCFSRYFPVILVAEMNGKIRVTVYNNRYMSHREETGIKRATKNMHLTDPEKDIWTADFRYIWRKIEISWMKTSALWSKQSKFIFVFVYIIGPRTLPRESLATPMARYWKCPACKPWPFIDGQGRRYGISNMCSVTALTSSKALTITERRSELLGLSQQFKGCFYADENIRG